MFQKRSTKSHRTHIHTFLDVEQTLDKINHHGIKNKIKNMLPKQNAALIVHTALTELLWLDKKKLIQSGSK